MKFFGVMEADRNYSFMMDMPILGLCFTSDEKFCIGTITGDWNDMVKLGHISFGYKGDFKEWINELKVIYEGFPDKYELKICSYKEACERALELYPDTMDIRAYKGSTFTYDLRQIKNNLKKIIDSK